MDESTPVLVDTYEYAGFMYEILRGPKNSLYARPVPGQHVAAARDRHIQAALGCWKDDRHVGRV